MHGHYTLPEPLHLVGRYVGDTAHVAALPVLDTHELAWAAGFFDGEGCTYLARHGRQALPTPCTEVNQIRSEPLERFRAAVGGLGSMRQRPDKSQRRGNPMWSFYTRNWRDTQAVLTLLWPYMSEPKRSQAAGVFRAYAEEALARPKLGQPHVKALWTATACPRGHADIYSCTGSNGQIYRRCRACRRKKLGGVLSA